MYEAHFGFSGPPFQLNPDPSFYFNSRGHGHALAYLRYGAAQGEGFIVVTGEIGAGKTTLVRTLLDELDRAKIVPAQIVSTQLAEGELLQAILSAYGIPSQGTSKASLLATLEAFLMALATQGRRALLIVDEAQNLQTKVIEELRMLSNFQLGTHALMQSFLVGQPELRKKLESPELEQLRQRVTASCHLGPLDVPETQAYIAHRLRRVGWDGQRPAFSEAAFSEVHRWSGGVPRRINRLCNRLLLGAFLEDHREISAALVERTALELRQEIGESFEPLPPETAAGAQAKAEATVPASIAVAASDAPIAVSAPSKDSASPPASPAEVLTEKVAAPKVGASVQMDDAPEAVDVVLDLPEAVPAAAELPPVDAPPMAQAAGEVPDCAKADEAGVDASTPLTEPAQAAPLATGADGSMRDALVPVDGLASTVETGAVPPAVSTGADSPSLTREDAAVPVEANAVDALALNSGTAVVEPVPAVAEVDEQIYQQALADIAEDVSGPHDVVRTQNLVLKRGYGVLLCLADTAASALKAAAIAKALAAVDGAPRLLLVNPGLQSDVWPWDEMESILPAMEVGLHLGVAHGAFDAIAPTLFERLSDVIQEFAPLGMISIGNSEAVLACSLMAHKRSIPVVRIEAGDRQGSDEASLNALLIEQIAEMLFATNVPLAHRTLHQLGIMPERVHGVAGRLAGDVLAAVEPAMTTPYGAFLRHNLPMFLGPRWSTQVDGTAYAVIALDVAEPDALTPLMDVLLEVYAVSKLVWLMNASTRSAMEAWLPAHPEVQTKVSVIPEGRLSRADVDRRNSASILCCQVNSLPDQFSILRGAVCLLSEPGQLLAEVSDGLDVPGLLRQGRRLTLLDPGHLPADHVWGSIVLNDKISQLIGRGQALLADHKDEVDTDPMRVPLPRTADPRVSPAQAISMRLQGWVTLRQVAHRANAGGAPESLTSKPDA